MGVSPSIGSRTASARGGALAAIAAAVLAGTAPAESRSADDWTGLGIMEEEFRRHQQFPYVYEEQTMVLVDGSGNRDVRRLRRFTRVETDATVKFLLVFDDPEEIRGVALLAVRRPDGETTSGVYLPAYGPVLKRPAEDGGAGHFLGTDFAVEDLIPDPPTEFRYVRSRDKRVDEVEYFVVEAYPKDAETERTSGYGMRRYLVRKDTFVIAQTDFYDRRLRFLKRLTRHDLKRVHGESWRANMIVVNDLREAHRTLLKIDRRVYSKDYVPAEIFEPAYLLANRHVGPASTRVAGGGEGGDG